MLDIEEGVVLHSIHRGGGNYLPQVWEPRSYDIVVSIILFEKWFGYIGGGGVYRFASKKRRTVDDYPGDWG